MRRLTGFAAALATLALTGGAVAVGAPPAYAAAVFVELNPNTVPAGDQVGVRASCDDNLTAATVTSSAFAGTVTVRPQYGFLTATVTVPARTRPDDYRVRLRCAGGDEATATLHVVARDRPSRGPATGFGGDAGGALAPGLFVSAGVLAIAAGGVLGALTLRRSRAGVRARRG